MPRTLVVPSATLMFTVVAAPKALMVVAVVLNTSKDVEPVTTLLVNDGLVAKHKLPAPVLSVIIPLSDVDVVCWKSPRPFTLV